MKIATDYVLDLTAVTRLPAFWQDHWPRLIPLRTAQHYRDFDIVDDGVPGLRAAVQDYYLSSGRVSIESVDLSLPIGVDVDALPPGAVIRPMVAE